MHIYMTHYIQFELVTVLPMNMPDDTLDLLKDFLPDIEEELRNQIEPGLEEEYANRLSQQLSRIEKQAEKEYEQALSTLQFQFQQLKDEKQHELQKELVQLQQIHQERQRQRLAQAQQKFLKEHFDDKIMSHPALAEIQESLQTEIAEMLFVKYSAIRDKRVKQLRVRLESREQKERVQADKVIKADIYSKSGLQELKEDLHKFKISIAAQKSQYNIKISKITTEIKALEKKCKDIQYQNSDLLIEQMQKEIEELQRQLTSAHQQPSEEASNDFNESESGYFKKDKMVSFGETFSKNKHFNLSNQVKINSYLGDAQYINQDMDLDSQDSLDQSNSNYFQALPPPPSSRTEAANKYISDQTQEPRSTYQHISRSKQEIIFQAPPKPLLNFNIAKMLREQWQEDSFDRYLSLGTDKENNSNAQNQSQSNFQSLYEEHLKKLNRDCRIPKMRKLSERTKQKILTNFSTRQRREQYN